MTEPAPALPAPCPSGKWKWAFVAGLFAIYLFLIFSRHPLPTRAFLGGDDWEYQSLAVNLAKGYGLKFGALAPLEDYKFDLGAASPGYPARFIEAGRQSGQDYFYRTPGYPLFLAVIYKLFGVKPELAIGIQYALIALIAALLPLLGSALLGWRGFIAGALGGLLFVSRRAEMADGIVTEPLIAAACFIVLACWAHLNRRPLSRVAQALFGLSLAAAVLVKGSLIFLPPLFVGYLALRSLFEKTYKPTAWLMVAFFAAAPIFAYSAWASARAHSFIFMSTQGPGLLLDGNNEWTIRSGDWHPEWRDDPHSFYRRALARNPGQSATKMVASFYREHWRDAPRMIANKLASASTGRTMWLFMALCAAYAYLTLWQATTRRSQWSGWLVVALLLLAAFFNVSFLLCFVFFLSTLLAGSGYAPFRAFLGGIWRSPGRMAIVLIILNFLLVTLITCGYERFVVPMFPVYAMAMFYAGIRLTERLFLADDLPVRPDPSDTEPSGRTWDSGSEGPESRPVSGLYESVRRTIYRRVARQVGPLARYCDALHYVAASQDDVLFDELHCRRKTRLNSLEEYPARRAPDAGRQLLVLNGTFNSSLDIQGMLLGLHDRLDRSDRLAVVMYNPYLQWAYAAASRLGFRKGAQAVTFVRRVDLENLASLSGFHVVQLRPANCFPFSWLGLGDALDMAFRCLPGFRRLALVEVAVLRPVVRTEGALSVSVIIPARNEKGNIAAAIERLPATPRTEFDVIFVEGHSTDGTWEEILRVQSLYAGRVKIQAFRQTGRGKADATRLGFAKSTGDLLLILDADLTMPPEMLARFIAAWRAGLGDFVNGSRLVYPMEGQAMRFLNRLGNVFFAKALSFVLDVRLGDTLCGTKLLARKEYGGVLAWREEFGDFDPFGDFELLFPAAVLALDIAEVPVRYRDRTYGRTNISRFRHGAMLLKMTWIGFWRVKLGIGRR